MSQKLWRINEGWISFHPKSPYYAVCADVVVRDVTHIKEHRHHIPTSFFRGRADR